MTNTDHPCRKIVCVVNPNSANGHTGRHWAEMQAALQKALGDFETRFTEYGGHASELTRQAIAEGADLIVSVGGDGTLNEVVNGYFDEDGNSASDRCALGIIPRGTGGDFRKTFGFSTDLQEAVDRLKVCNTTMVDVGLMDAMDLHNKPVQRYFVNILSFGMSGLVDHLCNTTTKALGGKASFLMATMRALWQWKNAKVRITLDHDTVIEPTIQTASIANGRYFGGGMMMAPVADVTDGIFDVVIMEDFTRLETITRGAAVYKGEHINDPKVSSYRASHITAEAVDPGGPPVRLDMDGETPGQLPITVQVVPRSLRLVV